MDCTGLFKEGEDPAQISEAGEEKALQLKKLDRAIERLTLRERTAFYFFHFEKMKQREIAEVMSTTISAVESLVHKAMKKIKKELA